MGDVADDGLVLEVAPTAHLPAATTDAVLALFGRSYAEADLEYARDAIGRLAYIGLGFVGTDLVGFSLADSRRLDLPRLPAQVVRLAGLACVAPEHRRHGLMHRLNGAIFGAAFPGEPGLFCGRMAHAATYRMMSQLRGVVPRLGVRPTPWQQDVGRAIAAAYGARGFDAETFVCRGSGRPIGWPRMEIDTTADERALFARVDRARGESLLGFAWASDPPPGWDGTAPAPPSG
ncbi:MAG TPA: hypothetical protein VKA21_03630 [Candidatus Binatia bacterium]|nr:hypothetical protein [Candidatus Binatia bacterium]